MATTSNDGLVTVDVVGGVRLWETSVVNLQRSLKEWKSIIGFDDKPLQLTIERESGKEATNPKHGKEDPSNEPHVGGNTWAGGTGGRDTAGLGGIGGPYRLDAGHTVYQVSQVEKDAVPQEVREAARQMAEKAFKERLKEIEMSEYDGDMYEKFAQRVRRQVQSLRQIIDNLQAKGKERQWLKNQTHGDIDDSKLIEALAGEKPIYKRRGEREPEMGAPQQTPKRLRLVVDVSGSMYRFNGHDGRLERELESVLMMMEALEGHEHKIKVRYLYDSRMERELESVLMMMEALEGHEYKIKYDIYGHSGEDHKVELLSSDQPPDNNKKRMDILKTMHAHSQFCLSGDHTLEATEHAITSLGQEEADERFVIVLSDANLERYGIPPKRFADILTADDKVNAYAVFIGSLGDQAQRLTKRLPVGRAFVCLDSKDLPQVLQQIFTSTLLSTR